ncbi:ABC transporter substrate-binding protein [Halobium palmae]|uniref:ABC transporter substrate-binding protein n=1 Tax=Halobium palmae TaxID=1776492 RepID=A0ABD5RX32_9EURY
MTDRNSVSRRRFLKSAGGAAAAVAIAGCSSQNQDGNTTGGGETTSGSGGNESGGNESTSGEGGSGEVDPDATLQYINSSVTTFDPVASTDEASNHVITNIHQTLTHYPQGTTQTESLLASDYSVSDDGLTYTFTLNDATHHNGDTVTASDVVYSWERLAASSNSRRSSFLLDVLGVEHETTTTNEDGEEVEAYEPGTLAMEATSETELEIQLASQFGSALDMIAYSSFSVIPEGIVGDIEGYDGEMEYNQFATSNPVGCGPYQLEGWEQGTSVDITRFDDYYGGDVENGGVHWQIMEEADAIWTYAMERNADAFGIPTSKYDPSKISVERTDDAGRERGTYGEVRNGATLNYSAVSELVTYYLGFNMAAVEKPVRQAFAHAADRNLIVQEVFKNRGVPAYHLTPPAIYPGGKQGYDSHVEESYPYGAQGSQLDQARQLMEDAGYSQDNRAEVTFTMYEGSSAWGDVASIMRDQLASAHINMNIESAPFATLTQRGRQGNLEVYTLGWGADYPAPDNFLQLLNPPQTITSGDEAPISYLNWTSENGDAAQQATDAWQKVLENKGPSEEAQQARNEAYVTMEEANWEDVGFLNLYHSKGESFWYDEIDYEPPGAMGSSTAMENGITKRSQ